MSKLGVNAYRFGIEWSRLQSAPFAPLNQNELARYIDLLDQLKAKGITPMVVLHHFSNPPWINAAGGWTNAATIPAFVDYVRQLVAALKDRFISGTHSTSRTLTPAWRICSAAFRRSANGSSASSAK